MLESKVEDHLCKRIKALGGEVRKMKWIGRKSAPDRLVLLPLKAAQRIIEESCYDGDRFIFDESVKHPYVGAGHTAGQWMHPLVELKRPGEVPRDDQLREHQKLRAAGFIVLVLDSIEAVDKAFPL